VLDPDAVSIGANQPGAGATSGSSGAGSKGGGATGNADPCGDCSIPGSGAAPNGGTAGASASGGTGASSGSAGAGSAGAPIPAGGAAQGGSAGTDPAVVASCTNYCSSSTQAACPSGVSARECSQSCLAELGGLAQGCQQIGRSLLDCLTTVYQNSMTCNDVAQLSVAKCASQLNRYESCVDTNGAPIPTPLPTPTPPAPNCASSGSSSNDQCSLQVKCDTGGYYTVSCHQTGPERSSCSCMASLPNGNVTGGGIDLAEGATFACYDTLAACGFPQIGAK